MLFNSAVGIIQISGDYFKTAESNGCTFNLIINSMAEYRLLKP